MAHVDRRTELSAISPAWPFNPIAHDLHGLSNPIFHVHTGPSWERVPGSKLTHSDPEHVGAVRDYARFLRHLARLVEAVGYSR